MRCSENEVKAIFNFSRSKKAIGHIEMIVSFTIFLVFALFVFSFLNPVKEIDISSSLLSAVESGVENYSTTLLELPVIVDEGVDLSGCFKIGSPFTSTVHNNIFVKNTNGDIEGFKAEASGCISPNSDPIGCISIRPKSALERVYYIYDIKDGEINSPVISCSAGQLSTGLYEFSIPRVRMIYLNSTSGEKTLDNLRFNYENNYDNLKDNFNFPKESDFAVIIKKQDTNLIKMELSKEKPKKVVVKAREIPITILEKTSSGEIIEVQADMSIQVW